MSENLFGDFSLDSLNDEVEVPDGDSQDKNETEEIEFVDDKPEVKDTTGEESEDNEDVDNDEKIEISTDEDVTSDDDAPSTADESSSLLTSFASTLHEKGIFSEFSEEEFTKAEDPYEALNSMIDKEISKGIEEYKASLDPDKRKEVDAIENGININQVRAIESDIEVLKGLQATDFEDESKAEQIVAADLASRNYSNEEIKEMIADYKDLGKLESRAKTSSKNLLSLRQSQLEDINNQAEQFRANQEKERQSKLDNITNMVKGTEEIVPGRKLSSKEKEALIKSLTTSIGKDKQGNPITSVSKKQAEDPQKFEMTLHYLNMLGVFDGKFDELMKPIKSKAVNKFKDTFERSNNIKSGKSSNRRTSNSDPNQLMKSFKETFNL